MALRLLDYLWATCYDAETSSLFHFVDSSGPHLPDLLSDHVRLAQADLIAFQFTGDAHYLDRATTLGRTMQNRLADPDGGEYADRPDDPTAQGALRSRLKPMFENAIAADVLITVHHLTGIAEHLRLGESALLLFADEYTKYDTMAAAYGLAVNRAVNQPTEIVVVGAMDEPRTQALLTGAWQTYMPWRIVLPLDPARDAATITTRGFPIQNEPAAFVCRDQTCSAPVMAPLDLVRLLNS